MEEEVEKKKTKKCRACVMKFSHNFTEKKTLYAKKVTLFFVYWTLLLMPMLLFIVSKISTQSDSSKNTEIIK